MKLTIIINKQYTTLYLTGIGGLGCLHRWWGVVVGCHHCWQGVVVSHHCHWWVVVVGCVQYFSLLHLFLLESYWIC